MKFCDCGSLLSIVVENGEVVEKCAGCGCQQGATWGMLGTSHATNWKPEVLSVFRFDPSMPREASHCQKCGNEICIVCDPVLMQESLMTTDRDTKVWKICDSCGASK